MESNRLCAPGPSRAMCSIGLEQVKGMYPGCRARGAVKALLNAWESRTASYTDVRDLSPILCKLQKLV